MRIAQIAPLAESCPPRLYGGTERIVSYLTEELTGQGHDVTLFASGDSRTSAELVSCCDVALRLNPAVRDAIPYHMMMLDKVCRRASDFDVLHFHVDLLHVPVMREFLDRTVSTLHGRLDLPDLIPFYSAFPKLPLASISYHQRLPMPAGVTWAGNVYNGLPRDHLPYSPRPAGGYLAFLGRISPEKRPDRAIEIAVRAGLPLKIAAKVDKADQTYWAEVIEPMVRTNPLVEFVGEIGDSQKAPFLGDAVALLFPIDWPEPFGLAMIEAMACGTPVIAFPAGSVSEVIDEGETGFVVADIEAAVEAVGKAWRLDRALVRARFEQRFTAEQMAEGYLDIYSKLASQGRQQAPHIRANGHPVDLRVIA
jgi:glycosyltransferase involved in cell wall biosynthesis